MENVVSLQDVVRTYIMGDNEVRALRGVSFDIEQGEFVSIMGPSGSGKSTCMNMIGCLDRPTSGIVKINGRETAKMNEKELSVLRNQTIGFVFQRFHLLPSDTALQNVMLPLTYAGIPAAKRKELATEALEKVGLSDRMDFKPNQLSGGQSQRVAIARAIVTKPAILFADEPTGSLDSENGAQIMELFRILHEEGVTIVMITHEREIAEHAERILYIYDGKISENERGVKDA